MAELPLSLVPITGIIFVTLVDNMANFNLPKPEFSTSWSFKSQANESIEVHKRLFLLNDGVNLGESLSRALSLAITKIVLASIFSLEVGSVHEVISNKRRKLYCYYFWIIISLDIIFFSFHCCMLRRLVYLHQMKLYVAIKTMEEREKKKEYDESISWMGGRHIYLHRLKR